MWIIYKIIFAKAKGLDFLRGLIFVDDQICVYIARTNFYSFLEKLQNPQKFINAKFYTCKVQNVTLFIIINLFLR